MRKRQLHGEWTRRLSKNSHSYSDIEATRGFNVMDIFLLRRTVEDSFPSAVIETYEVLQIKKVINETKDHRIVSGQH